MQKKVRVLVKMPMKLKVLMKVKVLMKGKVLRSEGIDEGAYYGNNERDGDHKGRGAEQVKVIIN